MRKVPSFLISVFIVLSQVAWRPSSQQIETIRACFYENAPKIYTDEAGKVTGFWPDLLTYIAVQEGWQIEWVHGEWQDCLNWLDSGEVDIVPDTNWTQPRAEKYAFNEESVLVSWTRLYARPGVKVESLLDLEGKTVGVLRGGANVDDPEGLRDLLHRLNIQAEIVEMDNYTKVFEALDAGQVDAAITSKDFGNLNENRYKVVRTPVILQPVRIQFAFPKDAPLTPVLINAIDRHLGALKTKEDSEYFQLQDLYFGSAATTEVQFVTPDWARNIGIAGGVLIAFLFAVWMTTRNQVKRRTFELTASEARLDAIVQQSADGISVTDEQGRMIIWNRTLEEITGISAEDVLGKFIWDVQFKMEPDENRDPQRYESLKASLQKFLQTGSSPWAGMRLERSIKSSSGEIRRVDGIVFPIRIDGGYLLGGITRDITERKQTEVALRKSEERFRLALENIPDVIVIYDKDFRIQHINTATQQVTGRPVSDFIGKRDDEIWPAEVYQTYLPTLHETFNTRKICSVETDLSLINNEIQNLHITCVPILDDHGQVREMMGITHNVTERKRAEEELRQSRDRLVELSKQLVETQERESRAIGRELHDQIGQMLTALKLTLEILPHLPADQFTKKIATAQELLDDLMNRVSALSLDLRPSMLDDLGLVPALLWRVSRYQEHTGIEVDFIHNGAEGRRFDPKVETTAYRVVQESLTNAARHARATRVRLEVRVRGQEMEILIEDNGAGFDSETAFAKHRGLSAMRERVRLLDGSFQVESQAGEGSKTAVRLPLQESE